VVLVSVRFLLSKEIVATQHGLLKYTVLRKVPNSVCVCVCSGTDWLAAVFLKLCEHYKVRVTECLPCSLGVLNPGLYVLGAGCRPKQSTRHAHNSVQVNTKAQQIISLLIVSGAKLYIN
jgi:hypothetical protein